MPKAAAKRKLSFNPEEKDNKKMNPPAAKKAKGHWSEGLKVSMNDPKLQISEDDLVTIIKDKYPKAKFHYLILPKENISNLKCLNPSHINLLKHMHEEAVKLTTSTDSKWSFKIGYHAIPSMSQVHLHVISKDFDSQCLKTKKHWNSFNTKYFIESTALIDTLEKNQSVHYDKDEYNNLLKSKLKCHICSYESNTIPALKDHISKHTPI